MGVPDPLSFSERSLNGGAKALECPDCGHDHMHQVGVRVYARDEEDASTGQAVAVEHEDPQTTVSGDVDASDGNPSGRRDGIVIQFSCEHCHGGRKDGGYHELVIAQHKGVEYVRWESEE